MQSATPRSTMSAAKHEQSNFSNAASLAFPSASFVTKLFGQFDFKAPVRGGDIIKIYSEVASRGTTSCKILVWAVNARTGVEVFRTFAVMVNARDGKKVPLQ
ncbi:MAG: hypothetical protein DME21_06030 [Verrucomicrobia bacterium]|nr:MAG: hypothetical protein DME21_06030 [Verrucomicrobiota bacterium]